MKEVFIRCWNCNVLYKVASREDLQGFKCEECGCTDWVADNDHSKMIKFMAGNMDKQSEPKLGIFWYDSNKDELVFIQQAFASELRFDAYGQKTTRMLHKDYWAKQYNRAKGKGIRWAYAGDWTSMPRGRVWELKDKGFVVTVGEWINKYPEARKIIIDEFDLPDNVEFRIDSHWNIGCGWSGDKI